MKDDTTLRIARHFALPPQLASLLHALLVEECLTPTRAANKGLDVPIKSAVHRLKSKMPALQVMNQTRVGYWLPDALRMGLALEAGVELPLATQARLARERRIAEGVVEILESDCEENISGGTNDRCPQVQLPHVQRGSGEAA